MTMVQSSAWIIAMQAGAFLGYVSFGFLADRLGRKPAFIGFLLAAAVMVPLYEHFGRNATMLLLLGPVIGFFGHGYFSVFGAMLAEIFPTHVRGSAQGFTYNAGRAFSALAPFTVGALAEVWGLGSALTLTSAFFLLGAGLMFFMPETRGSQLDGRAL
jgi:MFS family permease